MGFTSTPITGSQVPDNNEKLNQAYKFSRIVATNLERFVVMRFDTQSALTATLTGDNAPAEGMVAWIRDSNVLQVYDGGSWKRLLYNQPQIFSGTAAPSSSLGTTGDIYFQTG